MANDVVKTLQTKDGNFRVKIIREEYAESPRTLTDEPVYFEDYSREYTLMDGVERDNKYNSMETRVHNLLAEYADRNKIVDFLIENGRHLTDGKSKVNNALVYNRSGKAWEILEYTKFYSEKNATWKMANSFDCTKAELPEYIYEICEALTESCLEYIFTPEFVPDLKIATYKFGYYGGLQVWDGLEFLGDGLCWVIKDEFVKYTGYTEEQWQGGKLSENWLIKELQAYADNEVYGYKVEKKVQYDVTEKCISEERETENYTKTDWEETDSCWGLYGLLDDIMPDILDYTGYKMDELQEVDE